MSSSATAGRWAETPIFFEVLKDQNTTESRFRSDTKSVDVERVIAEASK